MFTIISVVLPQQFTNEKDDKTNYFIVIPVDDNNVSFLTKLEAGIRGLVGQSNLNLIKNKDKEYKGVSFKVYPCSSPGKRMNCKFRKRDDEKLFLVARFLKISQDIKYGHRETIL